MAASGGLGGLPIRFFGFLPMRRIVGKSTDVGNGITLDA